MKLIIGVRGTGKTKQLIEMVNTAAKESKGSVICIEYGNKLNFDVTYRARLIDATTFKIDDAHKLLGFVAGIAASDHDITDLFIDSALKICQENMDALAEIVDPIAALAEASGFRCVITISADPSDCPEVIQKYV